MMMWPAAMLTKCALVVFCSISLVGFITFSCFSSPVRVARFADGTSPDRLSSPGRALSLSGASTPLAAPMTAGQLNTPDMRTGGLLGHSTAVSVNAVLASNTKCPLRGAALSGECREYGHSSSPAGVLHCASGTLPGSIATRAFPFQASQHGSSRRERTAGAPGGIHRPSTLSIGADQ